MLYKKTLYHSCYEPLLGIHEPSKQIPRSRYASPDHQECGLVACLISSDDKSGGVELGICIFTVVWMVGQGPGRQLEPGAVRSLRGHARLFRRNGRGLQDGVHAHAPPAHVSEQVGHQPHNNVLMLL